MWLFGYGSLIWRPAFPYVERAAAVVSGYERRFEQASPDHRGTPAIPGRVVTLLPRAGGRCGGVVYRIAEEGSEAILAALDDREQGGYERVMVDATLVESGESVRALTWIAGRGNRHHLGPATTEAKVAQILRASGESGDNVEYVIRLDEALTALGFDDPEVSVLARALGERD